MLAGSQNPMMKAIADFLYPVGSYYITESSNLNTVAKMNAYFGGTWVALDAGRFLEAGTSVANKDAGLPNITGNVHALWGGETFDHQQTASGAFWLGGRLEEGSAGGNGWREYLHDVNLDASRSNSIYGKSTTVQPKSRTVYIYKRTALSGGGVKVLLASIMLTLKRRKVIC